MPNVISYTPPWLSRPSPGSGFFSGQAANRLSSHAASSSVGKDADTARNDIPYNGPTKIIARRGTEIFTVVDNQIRWANLVVLRDEWRFRERESRKSEKQGKGGKEGDSSSATGGNQEKGKQRSSSNGPEESSEDGSQQYRVIGFHNRGF